MIKVELWNDSDTTSPRSEDDCNSCTMVSSHTGYVLGDKNAKEKLLGEIQSAPKYNKSIEENYDLDSVPVLFEVAMKLGIIAAYKDLYIYDHSGITIATSPFSCRWDSGQYGFAYITKAEAREILNIKRISKKAIETLENYIDGEVETFDQYVRGDIYGFTIVDDGAEDDGDSCGGFYGSDVEKNGMKEHMDEKYHNALAEAEVTYD